VVVLRHLEAVGKKIKSLLDEQKDMFIQGCINNGIEKKLAKETWELIEPFARYGFNKAHSACYAVIAYQTAYCKANYPAEFMAALLTSDQHNTDRIAIEIEDARRMGLNVLPPDINESMASFSVVSSEDGSEAKTIRFGLNAVKNVGEHLVEAIILERKANGPFASLADVLERVQHKDLNKKSMESLAKVGAFDRFAERQQIISSMEEILKFAKHTDDQANNGQTSLFASLPVSYKPTLKLRTVPPAPNSQRGTWEKELMGLYISDHPLNEHRRLLNRLVKPISGLGEATGAIKIGGLISTVKKINTKRGEPMAFVRLEDLTGSIEVVVFPKLYQTTALQWEEQRMVIVEGKSNVREGEWKMLADKVWDLHQVAGRLPAEKTIRIAIDVETSSQLEFQALQDTLRAEPGDQFVEFLVRKGGQEKSMIAEFQIAWSPDLRTRLEARFGQCIVE
jgi:DNA polymerase-3 subunit alpha